MFVLLIGKYVVYIYIICDNILLIAFNLKYIDALLFITIITSFFKPNNMF